jgi:light-regulated signal transduction histidine kinase (bacteriophytochrome)
MQRELEELNAHKENVLLILSHDLKAHLRVLFRVLNILNRISTLV